MPYRNNFLIVAEQMITGNKFCLVIITSHIQRELHRTFGAKLITRAILKVLTETQKCTGLVFLSNPTTLCTNNVKYWHDFGLSNLTTKYTKGHFFPPQINLPLTLMGD